MPYPGDFYLQGTGIPTGSDPVTNTPGTIPGGYANLDMGGWQSGADAAKRNAVPDILREPGMAFSQVDEPSHVYVLKAGPWTATDADWHNCQVLLYQSGVATLDGDLAWGTNQLPSSGNLRTEDPAHGEWEFSAYDENAAADRKIIELRANRDVVVSGMATQSFIFQYATGDIICMLDASYNGAFRLQYDPNFGDEYLYVYWDFMRYAGNYLELGYGTYPSDGTLREAESRFAIFVNQFGSDARVIDYDSGSMLFGNTQCFYTELRTNLNGTTYFYTGNNQIVKIDKNEVRHDAISVLAGDVKIQANGIIYMYPNGVETPILKTINGAQSYLVLGLDTGVNFCQFESLEGFLHKLPGNITSFRVDSAGRANTLNSVRIGGAAAGNTVPFAGKVSSENGFSVYSRDFANGSDVAILRQVSDDIYVGQTTLTGEIVLDMSSGKSARIRVNGADVLKVGEYGIELPDASSIPVINLGNGVYIYSNGGALVCRGGAGTVTPLAPP